MKNKGTKWSIWTEKIVKSAKSAKVPRQIMANGEWTNGRRVNGRMDEGRKAKGRKANGDDEVGI